jgi:hypothetical protein
MAQIQVKVGEKPRPAPPPKVIFRKQVCCKTCDGQHCIGRCKF